MRQLRFSAFVFALITLFATSGCATSASNESPDSSPAPEPSTSESAQIEPTAEPQPQLTTCDLVELGYIMQVPDGEFEVCEQQSSYQLATGPESGLPATTATIGLSGYGIASAGSEITLNHPSSGASNGQALAIADRFNNRVLIYLQLPTGNAEPDVVIGQPDFVDTTPGTSLADMNWPGAVELTPEGTLLVADTENGRILVYKQVPTSNGAAADFSLDLSKLTGNRDPWPWGIWSDGKSLVVTDTRQGNILYWDSFPKDGNAKPKSSTNPSMVGTPRNITSDGTNFLIGDENGAQQNCWGQPPQNRNRQSHIWINRPPVGDPDGCIWDWFQGDASDAGLVALAAGGQDVHWWPEFPVDDATALNKFTTGSQGGPGMSAGHSYLGGDGGDVVVTGEAIYFIEYNGNRVTAWNEMPDEILGKVPDFSLFAEDPEVSTLLRDGFIQNPVLVNAGGALVATSDYDRRMYVWNAAPGENAARADFVYLTGFPAWDNTYADGTLIIAGRDAVAVWEDFQPGQLPTQVMQRQLGSIEIQDLKGVAYDGQYFAVADGMRDLVAVFEGIPTSGQQPIRELNIRGPGRLDMKDGVLAIAPKEGSEVRIVDLTKGGEPQTLKIRANLPNQAKFLSFGFGVADTSFHRVQIWKSLADALAGKSPALILGGDMGSRPETSADGFYFPASLESMGGHLYVGEFKFSNRILAFPIE
jgi:hypothetical protein